MHEEFGQRMVCFTNLWRKSYSLAIV